MQNVKNLISQKQQTIAKYNIQKHLMFQMLEEKTF